MTPRFRKFYEVMRVAYQHWRPLDVDLIQSWNNNPKYLNVCPILGKFSSLPVMIDSSDICESLTLDWENLTKILWACIIRKPRGGESTLEYTFGVDRVLLQNQVSDYIY